jgi:protease II
MQSVEDYTSCAEYLTGNKSILRSRDSDERTFIVTRAFSARGHLVGASVNENPELFHASHSDKCIS